MSSENCNLSSAQQKQQSIYNTCGESLNLYETLARQAFVPSFDSDIAMKTESSLHLKIQHKEYLHDHVALEQQSQEWDFGEYQLYSEQYPTSEVQYQDKWIRSPNGNSNHVEQTDPFKQSMASIWTINKGEYQKEKANEAYPSPFQRSSWSEGVNRTIEYNGVETNENSKAHKEDIKAEITAKTVF